MARKKTKSSIATVTDATFSKEVLRSNLPVLVGFWAPWCAPCHTLPPMLQEIIDDYFGKVKVVQAKVDENPDMTQEYRISSIPTLILFEKGKMVGKRTSADTKEDIAEWLDRHIDEPVGFGLW
jgi:thioredoxin 1